MKILIIKMSSLGDVVHTLPAITDLKLNFPHAQIDWVVEEAFAEIPVLHPAVNKIIPIAIRRWRKNWFKSWTEIKKFIQQLRQEKYDVVIDPQGLFKSIIISKLAIGKTLGYDNASIRSKGLAGFYHYTEKVDKNQHAVDRIRLLCAKYFNYIVNLEQCDFGITSHYKLNKISAEPFIIFLHCTTWENKAWSDWITLGELVNQAGFKVKLNAGNNKELIQAKKLADKINNAEVMPIQSIGDYINLFQNSAAVFSVDTGLGHLAGAIGAAGVGMYGPTSSKLAGIRGANFINLNANYNCAPCLQRKCKLDPAVDGKNIFAPCFKSIAAEAVWNQYLALKK